MATKFLDYIGLSYFCSKIKAWCNATFATITHNQASNTINAITGYTKPSTGSALTVTDSLNQALGKLEAKVDAVDDSNYVHKTGSETIDGSKTFLYGFYQKHGYYTRGTIPQSQVEKRLIDIIDVNNTRLGFFTMYIEPDGSNSINLFAYNTAVASGNNIGKLAIGCDSNGNVYTVAPTPAIADNSTKIATTAWVRSATGNTTLNAATATEADHLSPHSLGNDYEMTYTDFPNAGYYSVTSFKADTSSAPSGNVGDYRLYAFSGNSYFNDFLCTSPRQASLFFGHFWEGVFGGWHELCTLDTDQTFTGTKIFTKNTRYKSSSVTRGTTPSTGIELGFSVRDSANNNISALTSFYNTDKSSSINLWAYNTTVASGSNIGSISIGCDASGNVYTTAPTPASSDNSTQIATTAFVKNQNYLSGTVPIANGGTASTTRTGAVNSLFSEGMTTSNTKSFLVINDSFANAGWLGVQNARTVLGLSTDGNATGLAETSLGSNYEMTHTDFNGKGIGIWKAGFKDNTTSAPRFNDGDFALMKLYNATGTSYAQFLCMSPRRDIIYFGKFWNGTWQKWNEVFSSSQHIRLNEGNTIHRAVDTDSLWLCGGTSTDTSSFICLDGKSNANAGRFRCVARLGSTYRTLAGTYNGDLTWNGQTIQTSSDARLKTSLTSVPDAVLDAWSNVDWGQFKFLAAIEEKGDSARQHVGLIAQQVLAAFNAQGMDACDYGIACHDVWDDEYYEDTVTGEKKLINKAGETWMIRYTEALCMEAAYQRRKNKILEKRMSDLEEQLSSVLEILNNLKGA